MLIDKTTECKDYRSFENTVCSDKALFGFKTIPVTYILHFNGKISGTCLGGPSFGDEYHYVGYSTRPSIRFKQHRCREGSKATAMAIAKGLTFKLGAFFPYKNIEKEVTSNVKNLCKYCS